MSISGILRFVTASIVVPLALVAAQAIASDYSPPSPKQRLVILNWSEYIDPELVKAFEQQFNAEVSEVYFESDELRNDMLAEAEGAGYDLVMVNGVNLEAYRQRGWLAPLDLGRIANYRHIDPHWLQAFPAAKGYAVPYFWGTLGIAYRADLVDKPPTSWMDILRPSEALRGKINMIADSRDLLTTALKARGYSANSANGDEIAAAKGLLMKQQPFVKSYNYIALNESSALVTGDLVAAMAYSGDALMLQEHNENIEFVLPSEGSVIWIDYLAVMQKSHNKQLAMDFLNFINEPKNAAQLAEFVWYATPNKAAEKLLPEEFLTNPVIYPSKSSLAKSEFYEALPPRATKKRNVVFANIVR